MCKFYNIHFIYLLQVKERKVLVSQNGRFLGNPVIEKEEFPSNTNRGGKRSSDYREALPRPRSRCGCCQQR